MKLRIILYLVLVLIGVFTGSSQNYQTNDAERVENNREILRLATFVDSNKPPLTEEMLETGEFEADLFNNDFSDLLTHYPNTQRENMAEWWTTQERASLIKTNA